MFYLRSHPNLSFFFPQQKRFISPPFVVVSSLNGRRREGRVHLAGSRCLPSDKVASHLEEYDPIAAIQSSMVIHVASLMCGYVARHDTRGGHVHIHGYPFPHYDANLLLALTCCSLPPVDVLFVVLILSPALVFCWSKSSVGRPKKSSSGCARDTKPTRRALVGRTWSRRGTLLFVLLCCDIPSKSMRLCTCWGSFDRVF